MSLFLGASGLIGYNFIRDSLVKEWQQIAILRMERAAHQMDMRLHLPMQWMEAVAKAKNAEIQDWTLQQLKGEDGIEGVYLTWGKRVPVSAKVEKISAIEYFYPPGQETVGLRGELLDAANQPLGRLEALVSYKYLMKDMSMRLRAPNKCPPGVRGWMAHSPMAPAFLKERMPQEVA